MDLIGTASAGLNNGMGFALLHPDCMKQRNGPFATAWPDVLADGNARYRRLFASSTSTFRRCFSSERENFASPFLPLARRQIHWEAEPSIADTETSQDEEAMGRFEVTSSFMK